MNTWDRKIDRMMELLDTWRKNAMRYRKEAAKVSQLDPYDWPGRVVTRQLSQARNDLKVLEAALEKDAEAVRSEMLAISKSSKAPVHESLTELMSQAMFNPCTDTGI